MRRWATVTVLVFALVACGGGEKKRRTTNTSTTVTAPSTTTTSESAPLELTEAGLGALTIGLSTSAASDTGLIGSIGPGCELAGTGQQAAPLQGGVNGSATFDAGALSAISVVGGASTAAGISVGSSLSDVQSAYSADGYSVSVDDSTVDIFGIRLVTVTKNGQPAFGMTLDPATNAVTGMATPSIQFCE
ncbi:MAG: hypothetical protein EXQ79_10425 [Acidimicrobiia bacterium]|nr:hypothetical protein [Acidimicrobiia bacterium]